MKNKKVEFAPDLLSNKVWKHFQDLSGGLWKHSRGVIRNGVVIQVMDRLWGQVVIDVSHQVKENLKSIKER